MRGVTARECAACSSRDGVAFPQGIDTRSLRARGKQCRSAYFNIDRDISSEFCNTFPLIPAAVLRQRGWLVCAIFRSKSLQQTAYTGYEIVT